MKKISIIIILALLVTSCATTFYQLPGDVKPAQKKPAQRVEFTTKQNWINLGIATWQSIIQVVGVGIIVSEIGDRMEEEIKEMGAKKQ